MKIRKLDKSFAYVIILMLALGICGCGKKKDNVELELNNPKEYIAEIEPDFTEKLSGEPGDESENLLLTENQIFDLEEIKAFLIDMNNDMQNLTKRLDQQEVVTEEEVINCIEKYYDESLMDYAMFLYRIRPTDEGYFHDRRFGAANYEIDTDTEMNMVVQRNDFCEIGVTFEHHWERSWDKEVVPVRLEWKDGTLRITEISQWYNDFRYQYMPDELFTPKYFTNEEAQRVIEQFGTDEAGNSVILSITTDENGFILAGSSDTLLMEDEIDGLSRYEIYFAVQEIYARHGKKFSDVILSQHFNRQEWYRPYEKIFSLETFSAIEEANIQMLIQKGNLKEIAGKDYGNLYPVEELSDTALTEEEAVIIILNAFEMADEVICPKEENYIGNDDIFRIYSLGEYSDEVSLRDYLSSCFSGEAIDYVITIYTMCAGLCRSGENGCYQYVTEGTFYGQWQEIDLLDKTEIVEADRDMCRVKVPFVVEHMARWGLPNATSSGEFLLCKKGSSWTITEITQTYYDGLIQEYVQE